MRVKRNTIMAKKKQHKSLTNLLSPYSIFTLHIRKKMYERKQNVV